MISLSPLFTRAPVSGGREKLERPDWLRREDWKLKPRWVVYRVLGARVGEGIYFSHTLPFVVPTKAGTHVNFALTSGFVGNQNGQDVDCLKIHRRRDRIVKWEVGFLSCWVVHWESFLHRLEIDILYRSPAAPRLIELRKYLRQNPLRYRAFSHARWQWPKGTPAG